LEPRRIHGGHRAGLFAIHFGAAAAEEMARIHLLTPTRPITAPHRAISYGQFNPSCTAVGTFPADGNPAIDGGKYHHAFCGGLPSLRSWRGPTLNALAQGLEAADEMTARYADARGKIADPALAEELGIRLAMTRNLIRTNIGYVKVMFAYFDQMDAPSPEHHAALAEALECLATAKADFQATPGFKFDLFGVNALQRNAEDALKDTEAARERLARIPNRREIEAPSGPATQLRGGAGGHKDDAKTVRPLRGAVVGQECWS
jgi:hypothetical protein